jgi:Uma2 family endonuclease
MGIPTIHTGPMTVEEFYAFTDRRPDEEKWELIEGEPVLNASPSPLHQWIIKNIVIALGTKERELKAPWGVLPGLGVRVSERNRPEPDVLVLPLTGRSIDPLGRDRSDVIVAFEVLSLSTEGLDIGWKRSAYTKLSSLTHYVIVSQETIDVVVFARASGFAEQRLRSLHESVELPSLGISLPLAEIYRATGLPGVARD